MPPRSPPPPRSSSPSPSSPSPSPSQRDYQPTYAAVAARPLSLPFGNSDAEVDIRYGPEDVDRQPHLDELGNIGNNPFNPSVPDADGWTLVTGNEEDGGTGMVNQGSDGPSGGESVISASSRHLPGNGLAPILSLDELLSPTPGGINEVSAASQNQNENDTGSRRRRVRVMQAARRLPSNTVDRLMGNNSSAPPSTSAPPNDNDGTFSSYISRLVDAASARNNDITSILASAQAQIADTDPLILPQNPARATTTDGIAASAPRGITAVQSAMAAFERSRQRREGREGRRINAADTGIPPNIWNNSSSDIEDDWEPSRPPPPRTRHTARRTGASVGPPVPFYSHPNLTGDFDEEDWGLITGGAYGSGIGRGGAGAGAGGSGSGSGSGLARGSNNRRRRSFLDRAQVAVQSLMDREGWDDRAPPSPSRNEIVGMEPTNSELARAQAPLVVRSSGNRRQRSDSSERDSTQQPPKRRKMQGTKASSSSPSLRLRPSYLSHSCLSLSTVIPETFEPPIRSSFLRLYTKSTNGKPPRPTIRFGVEPFPTRTDDDASALRSNVPIPVECGVHYFEVEVISQGEEGFMSVGWMLKGSSLRRLVGWDKGSWGYHADDGMSFNEKGSGERYSEKWGAGDVIGAGIDFTIGRAFYTKNGRMLGHRFSNLGQGMYPAIGLRSPGEEIAVNFTGPFMFDIENYIADVQAKVRKQVDGRKAEEQIPRLFEAVNTRAASQVEAEVVEGVIGEGAMREDKAGTTKSEFAIPDQSPLQDRSQRSIAAFVLDHLLHHGYTDTLAKTRMEMQQRQWVSPATSASGDATTMPSASTSESTRQSQSHALSILERINKLQRQLTTDFRRIPLDEIVALDPKGTLRDARKPLLQRCAIHQLIHLIRLVHMGEDADDQASGVVTRDLNGSERVEAGASESDDDDAEMKAIAYGKELRKRSKDESWGTAEKNLLDEAFGVLALGFGTDAEARWSKLRRLDGEVLDIVLRTSNDLRQASILDQAVMQVQFVNKVLAQGIAPEATFLHVKEILK